MSSPRHFASSYAFDVDEYTSSPLSTNGRKTKTWIYAATILVALVLLAFSVLRMDLGLSQLLQREDKKQWGAAEYLDPELHKKASVMNLGKPYDRMRDVVWDQPVRNSDVKVFWQTRETGSDVIVEMLSDCFGLTLSTSTGRSYDDEDEVLIHKYNGKKYVNVDTTTIDGLERARDLELVSSGMVDVVVSPHIREVCDIFTESNQGRMFAFFRHPIEREYARAKEGKIDDNWMTRLLLDKPKGDLDFKDLGNAKKVVREKCVVGLLDQNLYSSIERIQNYFGWTGSEVCVEKYAKRLPYEQLGDRVNGDDEAWKLLGKHNEYDIQLYELARSVFRAQEQTIVPLEKQIEFAEENK